MAERVYARQWHASKDAQAWRVLPEGATAFFRTDSFETSVRFLDAIGALLGQADPDLSADPSSAPGRPVRGDARRNAVPPAQALTNAGGADKSDSL